VPALNIIRLIACEFFGSDVSIWLFCFRVDDRQKGGDYDYLIETSPPSGRNHLSKN
jgi:hypothetical protein